MKCATAVLGFILFPLFPLCAAADFQTHTIDSNVGYVRTITDINGDGLPDIVASGDGGIYWYEYPSWIRHTLVGSSFNWSGDNIEDYDVDGDGDNDIVGCRNNNGNGKVVILENPLPSGDPFSPWNYYQIGDAGQVSGDAHIKDLEVADFNRDGYIDVAARVHQYTYIFIQQGEGSWQQAKRTNQHPPEEGLAVADLDEDGDPDLVLNGFWLRNPYPNSLANEWAYFEIDPTYHNEGVSWPHSAAKVAVVDIDNNGKLDVILSDAEQDPTDFPSEADPLAWYSATNPTGSWTQHIVDDNLGEAHTLLIADFDFDGDLDIFSGQMSDNGNAPVRIYYNDGTATHWTTRQIANNGIYSGAMGDIGRDGDMDVVGVQDWNDLVVELYENRAHEGFVLDEWQYTKLDGGRSEYSWAAYMGLDMGDLTGDGLPDIVSGKYFYRNQGGDLTVWNRVVFPINVDASLIVDVDGDRLGDVIGMAETNLFWLEANDRLGNSWTEHQIQTVVATGHDNTQGYALGQIVPGGRPEIIMAFGDGMWFIEIPAVLGSGNWPKTKIHGDNGGGGLGVGYVDNDAYPDVVAGFNTQDVAWYRNPGDGSAIWQRYSVGVVGNERGDRFAVADIDADGHNDLVVSTEEYPHTGEAYLYWFEAPDNPLSQSWTRHQIPPGERHDSLNSMDVADMDSDGDLDIITGEIFGDMEVVIWENDGSGSFTSHRVDSGKESHLGTQVADLDNDGDLDIVSIAWHQPEDMHLWRNDCFVGGTGTPIYLASFTAERLNDQAILNWHLTYVYDHAGIYVWRQERGRQKQRISDHLLTTGQLDYEFIDTDPPAAETEYWLQEIGIDGSENWFGPALLELAGELPTTLSITRIYPNPFNLQATIRYTLPSTSHVHLAIYDMTGRLVKTLVDSVEIAGPRAVEWNGKTGQGEIVASGVYFARLKSVEGVETHKIILAK